MLDADADDTLDAAGIEAALVGFRQTNRDIRRIVGEVRHDLDRDRHRNLAAFVAITLALSVGGFNIYENKQADHRTCRERNESRALVKGVWDRFLHIVVPDPAQASPAALAGLREMNSVLEVAYRQRPC